MKSLRHLQTSASLLLAGASFLHAQSDDLFDGVLTPGLRFLPREVRELMVYEEPWLARTPSPVSWRPDFDERDFRRRGADVFAIEQAELFKRRIGGTVDVPLRTDDQLDGEWFDLKTYVQWFSQRDDELSWQSRLRFDIPIPEQDAGLMVYYRHRERKDRMESEHTKWAGAQNMPDGPDTAFIHQHELRSSPEDEIMDEIGAVLRWDFSPTTQLRLGGSWRQQDDQLYEQRREYDTRAGTVELPGGAPRRGYPYDAATDVVVDGIVREATLRPGVGRIERQLKDELEKKERWAAFLDFRHEYAERSWIDVQADYSKRTNREPNRQDTEFAERPDAMWTYQLVGDRPIFTPTPLPDNTYGVRKIELENNIKQREYAYAQALVHHELVPHHVIEGGGFALRHTDFRNIDYQRFEPNPSPAANGFNAVAGGPVDSILGIDIGTGIDPAKARAFFAANRGSLFLRPAESFFKNLGEDYDMEREIFGGHLLYRYDQEKWRVHAGARYESAKTSGSSYDAQWTGNEATFPVRTQSAVRPTSMSKTENDLLPTVLVEYQPQRNMLFSANLRQTLQRPELREAAPSRYVNSDDGVTPVALLGNPDLDSSRQTQFVLTGNHAFAPGSMLRLRAEAWKLDAPLTSAGWFAPYRLDNPAIPANLRPERNYRFEQTLNADDGDLFRLGAHYAQTFHFLPHPFDQLGAFAFFDYTDSSQDVTVDGKKRKTPLTYQPDLRGGGGLFYRSNRWEAMLYADMYDKYLISVGETANGLSGTGDLWVEDRLTLNASITYRITKDLEIYTELTNLTDTDFRMYEGTSQRQTYREKAGRSVRLGLHWFF